MNSQVFSVWHSFAFNPLRVSGSLSPLTRQIVCSVEHLTNTDRACAVAAAAAHDFNNELTVILSSVTGALETVGAEHPAHLLLLDLEAAAQRCVWKASGLLNFSTRVNPHPVRASFEFLIQR
jgi:hypothetical protein